MWLTRHTHIDFGIYNMTTGAVGCALPSALGFIPLLGDNGPEVSVEHNAGEEGGGTVYTKRKREEKETLLLA